MSNLKMLFYTAFDGAEWAIIWNSQEEYDLVKEFLERRGVVVSGISANGVRVGGNFVYIENEQQLEDLSDYVQSLREKRADVTT
jgi:hypothetical protein